MRPSFRPAILAQLALASVTARSFAQTPPLTPDVPAHFDAVAAAADYVKRVEMIPMRDGVKLYTVIVIPKGAAHAPILLTRTPYNAAGRAGALLARRTCWRRCREGDEVFVADGYIRVFQDVRGKYGSEGDYVMTRPAARSAEPDEADHSTDAYDTIDWLVKNVPESNGRVGMLGSSYEGFTVVMALVHPHPALKVAAPESPMVDGWMGDDWFHYGAFRSRTSTTSPDRHRRAARARSSRARATTTTRTSGAPARRATSRAPPAWISCLVAQGQRASRLRQLLAGAGARPRHGRPAAHSADDVDSGAVGSGRHVGRDPLLPGGRAEGHRQRHGTFW